MPLPETQARMKPFEDLTKRGQLGRLADLAYRALEAYDLTDPEVTPLQYWLTASFRVDAGDERFVLRIYRPAQRAVDSLLSELAWLCALRHDTDLAIPEVVPSRDGSPVRTVSAGGVTDERACVLLRWQDGQPIHHPGARELEAIGGILARLHLHACAWDPPEDIVRPSWDAVGLLGGAVGLEPQQCMAPLSAHERAVVGRCAEQIGRTMVELGKDRDVWGMIHADIHAGNILSHSGNVSILDFDLCGWGYYLYDMAVLLSTLPENATPNARAAVLRGYRRLRPLPTEHERHIDIFLAGRVMGRALWIAAHIDDPAFRERGRYVVAREMRRLETLVEGIQHGT